jgi:CRISPR-associated protein Csy3
MAKQKIPSVLACEKKLVASDATMFALNWNEINEADDVSKYQKLELQTKSVKGTISNRFKKTKKVDEDKFNESIQKANLQVVDYCSLPADKNTLAVRFSLKILGGLADIASCNCNEFRQQMQENIIGYIEEHSMSDLADRYATNIANARFLWRNRLGTEHITVKVKILNEHSPYTFKFNAHEFSLKSFDKITDDLQKLSIFIGEALCSPHNFLTLQITAYAQVGMGQEVYPSEELVLDKADDAKSKILFETNNQAGMHSQKIGNALRTIDTWYPETEDEPVAMPIACEPYGAVTSRGKAYRKPTSKKDFYTLFDGWFNDKILTKEDAHYVIAILIRGGVFGESSKG